MKTDDKIRNMNDVTTGDFISFEFLQQGTWRRARISGTALSKVSSDRKLTRAEAFTENLDRIALAASVQTVRNPEAGEVFLSSDDF